MKILVETLPDNGIRVDFGDRVNITYPPDSERATALLTLLLAVANDAHGPTP